MTASVHPLPVRTPQSSPSPLMLVAASYLTADGITPQHAWRWDSHWADPDLRDDAVLNLAEALAFVQGVPSPLETLLSATGSAAILAASGPVS